MISSVRVQPPTHLLTHTDLGSNSMLLVQRLLQLEEACPQCRPLPFMTGVHQDAVQLLVVGMAQGLQGRLLLLVPHVQGINHLQGRQPQARVLNLTTARISGVNFANICACYCLSLQTKKETRLIYARES